MSDREQVRCDFFDKVADGWEDRNYRAGEREKIEKMFQTLPFLPGMTVVDVGCGEGVIIPYIRKYVGDKALITALDASAEMLKGVALKDPLVPAIHAAAENMPLIDNYADMVLCFSAFPHFSDKKQAAKEFFRILKPGGRAYVLHIDSAETINRHHDKHAEVAGDHLPCRYTMKTMFTDVGFTETSCDEGSEHYIFMAVKPTENK